MQKFSIPTPCHENWDEMIPEEKGRFCDSCQKCVIDFTDKSDKQVLKIFQNAGSDKICGRFTFAQLHSKNKVQRIVYHFSDFAVQKFRNNKLMPGFIGGLMFLAGCEKKKEVCTATTGILLPPQNVDSTKFRDTLKPPPILGEVVIDEDSAQIFMKDVDHLTPKKEK